MLDFDLSEMYSVETRVLKQAVRTNKDRFPEDFMFQLTAVEIENMVSQSVIPSKSKLGGAKPFAFTEQGVSMLSSMLNSKKAIQTIGPPTMRGFGTNSFPLSLQEIHSATLSVAVFSSGL